MSEESSSEVSARAKARGSDEQGSKPYDPEELIGETLGGRFEVERCIGKGGMGVVYLANQSALGRKVVVKVLSSSLTDNKAARARFEREAVGLSRLQHPNIVAIYDFGHEQDLTYICMEYVAGETLSRRMRREGPMPVEQFGHIAAQILGGIEEAHAHGMIHRDLKPSNIMLTERSDQKDCVKILDFGLAKLVEGAREVTSEQKLVGSATFLSPEQILGEEIDQTVDIYALGVLFYYMLSGDKPFESEDDIAVLYQHVHNQPPPLSKRLPDEHLVPAGLVDLVERMLAKDSEERPESASQVLAELEHAISQSSQVAWLGNETPVEGFDDPSAQLDRGRFRTPVGGAAPATRSTDEQVAIGDHSSSIEEQSFVTDEQVRQMQRQNTRRTLLIVAAAIVLVAGAATAYLVTGDDQPPVGQVEQQLGRADQLIDGDKLGQAGDVLALVESDVQHHPQLKSNFAELRDELEIARYLREAQRHADDEEFGEATEACEAALNRDPSHREARALLEKVRRQRTEPERRDPPTDSGEGGGEDVDARADETAGDQSRRDETVSRREESDEPAGGDTASNPGGAKDRGAAEASNEASEREDREEPAAGEAGSGADLLPVDESDAPPSDDDSDPLLPVD